MHVLYIYITIIFAVICVISVVSLVVMGEYGNKVDRYMDRAFASFVVLFLIAAGCFFGGIAAEDKLKKEKEKA